MSKTTLLLLAITLSLSTAGAQDPAAAAPPAGAFDLAGSIQRGKGVYMQTCLVCHQATGLGLPGAFPPIAQTDYTTGDARRMVAIVLKGVMGPIKVKDITYNNIMLPVDVQFPFMKD
ncbi:MAG TPA: cytochrome c, partial [Chthoniobacteraceae bacterium]|nr:cytochrome c [Chthoniobacteraceae bacterium]